VTDCKFREIPESRYEEDDMRGDDWFYVGESDVFPETFINFLGLDAGMKQVFLDAHRETLTADWWRGIQERLREGDLLEVLPYHKHRVRVFSSLV
jgi:isocitrate dehydrogenase kinase/phosphatase